MSAVVRDHLHWELVLEKLEAAEMPPEKAKQHPTTENRADVVSWIRALRRHEALRNAGDPGPVLARRLSNAEYDNTIRDLTGADIRPTREFPVDPANPAGFDNSGESLAMSPALLRKYLDAARRVAEHIAFQPRGFSFAPHPVVTDTDRDKYAVLRIIEFYKRQPTDLADYFHAAWRFKHRNALGHPDATLLAIAAQSAVSARYLTAIWSALEELPEDAGPGLRLQSMWRSLPVPERDEPASIRERSVEMRDFVVKLREKLEWRFKNLNLKGIASGSQPFVLWKNRQYATNRTTLNRVALQIEPAGAATQTAQTAETRSESKSDSAGTKAGARPDPDLRIPADPAEQRRHVAAFERFCRLFPDAFYVSERGRMHLDRAQEREDKGRFLSAGYHNMFGYFRDDLPLYEMVLDEQGRRELDALWEELDFVTSAPMRQHADFIFYERAEPPRTIGGAEFDFVRSEDKNSTSEPMIRRLAEAYVEKARVSFGFNGGDTNVIEVLQDYFERVNSSLRRVEQARLAAEPHHLSALLEFAERAFRRPLILAEGAGLKAFYQMLREKDGLEHEDAIRDSVISVLMSPHFCYRIDLLPDSGRTGSPGPPDQSSRSADSIAAPVQASNSPASFHRQPLSDHALASRLSYFVWSSMPDQALLARAAAGELHRPEIIAAEARRMLRDPRARSLATEFGGQWLEFRRFEEHNAVDRERFPAFNDELRRSMFEEPIRLILDVVQNDRSVLDLLFGNDTFVNAPLARHYGMANLSLAPDEWVHVPDARPFHRGGLLPMAVFLTQNAPGLRTSPVKRGYWVVRRVLGEHIPPPPAEVPDLPNDEVKLGDLTLREVLARHRADKSCAACHERFDSFGLVFEGYGPVGEKRDRDLGGRPVDTRAAFPGGLEGEGLEGEGLEGLRLYVREHRQEDFLDNFSRKLLAYALGRSLLLSDDPAIESMRAQLAAQEHRFGALVESIVTSPQFLMKRSRDPHAQKGD
jgi:hypothetical protein